ncbi:MAG: 50S ribosomal protein L6, partial [Candidatus Hydrogenedentes bacterium]|nr:50S ribosomal protein L6 [Candidatus Hydrogenedentota bacterium]
MSRIGKLPVAIPDGVKTTLLGMHLTVKGPKGVLERDLHPDMNVTVQDKEILVTRPSEKGTHRALHGLTRALIQNMVTGVTQGFEKTLKIEGVG